MFSSIICHVKVVGVTLLVGQMVAFSDALGLHFQREL